MTTYDPNACYWRADSRGELLTSGDLINLFQVRYGAYPFALRPATDEETARYHEDFAAYARGESVCLKWTVRRVTP